MNYKNVPLIAVICVIISDFCIVLMGHFTKELEGFYSPIEIAFLRNVVAFSLVCGWLFFTKRFHMLKTDKPVGHLIRSAIGTLGLVLVFWSYTLIPLVMVTTVLFMTPILTLVFSIFFLKEKAGLFRWGAVLAGFLGMVIVSLPSFETGADTAKISHLGVIIALIAATSGAVVQITLRALGREGEPAITTLFFFLGFGTIALGIPSFLMGFNLIIPAIAAIISLGLVGLASQAFKTVAYQTGEASLLAPFRYLSLIWSSLIGYFFWQEIPTIETMIGAAIIIGANIVIVIRENRK